MCINSQNIVCFFSDVVNTCVVYIEQATTGRGGEESAAIYHRLFKIIQRMCLTLLFHHYRTQRISNNGYIFHSLHFIQVMYVTVGYIFQTAAGLAQMVRAHDCRAGGRELVSQGQTNNQG